MHILFVTPYYEPAWVYGGPARSIPAWVRALVRAGCQVDVFTTMANGVSDLNVPVGRPLFVDGVQITYFARWRSSGNRFFSPQLALACQRHIAKYDVLHSVGLWTFPAVVATWVANSCNIPVVSSIHGALMPWALRRHSFRKKLFMDLVERRRLTNALAGICTSPLELNAVSRLGLFRHLELVPNVVEIPNDFADLNPNPFRERLNIKDAFVFLFAGRLVKNKGVDLTLAAFMQAFRGNPKVKLVIVGPDEDDTGQILRDQVWGQGMSEHILFTGMLEGSEYWNAIASADVFVLNSSSENFGMSVAEAMAFGVPVIISEHVGVADWVKQYDAGIVTTLEVDCIAAAMSQLLARRNELPAMGNHGVRLVQENFSAVAVGQRFANILEDVVRQARKI